MSPRTEGIPVVRVVFVLALLTVSALAGPGVGAQEPAESELELGALAVSPLVGTRGAEVTVEMDGLAPNTGMVIAFGGLRAGYQWVEQVTTDEEGRLSEVVTVPDWPDEDQTYYFFLKLAGQAPVATSAPFHVTARDGTLGATGEITDDGREWLTMKGPDGERYCLTGEVGELQVGDRVRVSGTATDLPGCSKGIGVYVESHRSVT